MRKLLKVYLVFSAIAILVLIGGLAFTINRLSQISYSVTQAKHGILIVGGEVNNTDSDVQDAQTKIDNVCSALSQCY